MKKLISLLIVCAFVFVGCGSPEVDPRTEEIAKCLGEKGAKMYGAVWCGHCNSQKKGFGDAWEYINYIECDPQTDKEGAIKCVEADLEGFPTWEFANGDRLLGRQNMEVLAEKAGC